MPATKKTPLPPASTPERLASLFISRMKNDRSGVSPIFHDDCENFVLTIRSIHRCELDAAEAMERVREFAASQGLFFEAMTRRQKKRDTSARIVMIEATGEQGSDSV